MSGLTASLAAGVASNSGAANSLSNAMLGSAGISAGTGLISSIGNWIQGRKNRKWQEEMMEKQNQFNAEQAQLQRDYTTEMWMKENNYNLPAAQMRRLLNAGINPNSAAEMVSSQGASAGSGSSASAASAPTPVMGDVTGPLMEGVNNAYNNMLGFQNYRLTKAKADFEPANQKANLSLINANIDKAIKDANLSQEQADQMHKLTPILVGKGEAEVQQINAAVQLAKQEYENAKQQLENMKSEKEKIDAETAKIWSERTGQIYKNIVDAKVAELAQQGIMVNASGFGAWLSLALSGEDNIANGLSTAITGIIKGLTHGIKDSYDELTGAGENKVFEDKLSTYPKHMRWIMRFRFKNHPEDLPPYRPDNY